VDKPEPNFYQEVIPVRYTESEFNDLISRKVQEQLKAKNKAYHPARATSGDTGGFDNLAEFALAVVKAERKTKYGVGEIDPRLETKAAGSPSVNETPDAGGYLLPEEFRAEILEVAIENSDLLRNATKLPIQSNNLTIPSFQAWDRSSGQLFGGVSFQWVEPETQLTGVRPKLGQIGLKLKKLAGMAYVSNEILEDSPITLEPLLQRIFSESLTWSLDEVALAGSGMGQPLGVLNAPCLITVDAEVGQNSATLCYENVVNMYSRIWRKSSCVWVANDDILPQLATMSLAVGTGGIPVFLPAGGYGGASARPFDTLFGKPIVYTEHAQTLGTCGDIMLCDFSQYLLIMKSDTPKWESSLHLKFDVDQVAFRLIARLDAQPWWSQALTTRHSAKTLSPFVALASRN
jgi:HK97 family phage major capsid protein